MPQKWTDYIKRLNFEINTNILQLYVAFTQHAHVHARSLPHTHAHWPDTPLGVRRRALFDAVVFAIVAENLSGPLTGQAQVIAQEARELPLHRAL